MQSLLRGSVANFAQGAMQGLVGGGNRCHPPPRPGPPLHRRCALGALGEAPRGLARMGSPLPSLCLQACCALAWALRVRHLTVEAQEQESRWARSPRSIFRGL